jgi:APA family basic amino acid/polyamine antiporter
MAAPPAAAKLLGPWMALALVVGNMIGSGIFLLPAQLAHFGWNAAWAWLITIVGALCLAYVIAGLARALPQAGGAVGFLDTAFGPLAAFVVGWAYLVALWVGIAAIAAAAVSYLSVFYPPVVAGKGAPALLAIGLIWTLIAVNLAGVRAAGGFQLLTTALKLLPLVAVAAIAARLLMGGAPAANPYDPAVIAPASIATAAALTLWAMLGFESASLSQARIANAERVVPWATLGGALIAGGAYLAVCMAMIAYLPTAQLATSNAPFADFIAAFWGRGPALFVALFAAISAIGACNGFILLQGELPRAMAHAGYLPRWLAAVDGKGTPFAAILASGVVVSGLTLMHATKSLSDLFGFLALVATAANLILYFGCASALVRLAIAGRMAAGRWLWLVTIVGLCYSLWTFYGAGLEATSWTLALVVAGVPLYLLFGTKKAVVPAE